MSEAHCTECGQTFTLPGKVKQAPDCPSCGGRVAIEGRAQRRVRKSKSNNNGLVIGLGVLVFAIIALFFTFGRGGDEFLLTLDEFEDTWAEESPSTLEKRLAKDKRARLWKRIKGKIEDRGWTEKLPKLGERSIESRGQKSAVVHYALVGGDLKTHWTKEGNRWRIEKFTVPTYDKSADPPKPGAITQLNTTINRLIDAWNRDDIEGVAALCTPDRRNTTERFLTRQIEKHGSLPDLRVPSTDFRSRIRVRVAFSCDGGNMRSQLREVDGKWRLSSVSLKGVNRAVSRAADEGRGERPVRSGMATFAGGRLSDEALKSWANELTTSLAKGDSSAIDRNLDADGMAKRISAMGGARESSVRRFTKQFKSGNLLTGWIREGQSVEYLRRLDAGGSPRAAFRLYNPDTGGLNFFALTLGPGPLGEVRIIDGEHILGGESWCAGFARRLKSNTTLNSDDDDIEVIMAFMGALSSGDSKKIVEHYERLYSSAAATEITHTIAYLSHLGAIDADRFLATRSRFRGPAVSPHCWDLLSFDVHYGADNFAKAIAALDLVKTWIGGDDPYLQRLVAICHAADGKASLALDTMERALKADGKLPNGYELLAQWSLATEDWERCAIALDGLGAEGLDLSESNLLSAGYLPFLESARGKSWRKDLEKGEGN